MGLRTTRLDEATCDANRLIDRYGPIGLSAVRAAVSIPSAKPAEDGRKDKLDRFLVPEHLPDF